MTEQAHKQPTVDWVKVLAGALAAVVSAVLLSTLGAAGTLIGAALGSMVATVGNAVFSRGIDASKQGVVTAAQSAAARRVGAARAQLRQVSAHSDDSTRSQERVAEAHHELDDAEEQLHDVAPEVASGAGWRRRLAAVGWKHVMLGAVGLFVASMVVITVFELVGGRAVSSLTGGSSEQTRTSLTGLVGSGSAPAPTPTDSTPTEAATETPAGTGNPTSEPTPTAADVGSPTTSPDAGATETEGQPTTTSTPTPSSVVPTPEDAATVSEAPPAAGSS